MPDHLITIAGTVQGVGFRPFVARLATRLGVQGWVRNDLHGVQIRARAPSETLAAFLRALASEPPPAASIANIAARETSPLDDLPAPDGAFTILASRDAAGPATVAATPDLALCEDCRRELLDPGDRRHGYPFINCTGCGPRYSILLELPYDRPHTTMRGFAMCPDCGHEYHNPSDRRHHAQPNACPACGPQVALLDSEGRPAGGPPTAIRHAAEALLDGRVVAVKGVGGFHLLADATNAGAVLELRRRKRRGRKPFAVMFPDLVSLRLHAEVPPAEEALLAGAAAPIVLLRRLPDSTLAAAVAPENPYIGALLPYSPLHLLLLRHVGRPVVATSGNLAEEPLCIDNAEATVRLRGLADLFLVHDRPIAHPVDDSVVRPALAGRPIVLRLARGYAPLELPLPAATHDGEALLCVGGQMKNAVALAAGRSVTLGPHIGDLATVASQHAFERAIDWLASLHHSHPDRIVCDTHPDYDSTRYAQASGLPVTAVQHHLAHVFACLVEHPGCTADRILGVSWDGTGHGSDGTIWGGEFILVDRRAGTARRVARLRPFRLPGGEAAIRDPRRSALGLLHSLQAGAPPAQFAARLGLPVAEAALLGTLLDRGLQSPITTSAGRLFDGFAALLGLCHANTFEGEAPMQLEFAAEHAAAAPALAFPLGPSASDPGVFEIDWRPALTSLLAPDTAATPAGHALGLHLGLAAAMVSVAHAVGIGTVALSGGCFQNRILLALARRRLGEAGFDVLTHRALPPNDGNLAVGQALAARLGITTVR